MSEVHGGSVSRAFRLRSGKESYILKCRNKGLPEFFEKEKDGLNLLRISGRLKVPEVLACGSDQGMDWIVMEYLEPVQASPAAWKELAAGLADLHRCSNAAFGLAYSNYIGELVQQNEPEQSWEDFFIRRRLMPMVSLALDYFNAEDNVRWERLYARLGQYGFTRKPSLVHGDLWQGNVLFTASGPVLIDPAVYFGVPEADIGMSYLFGGFDKAFYDAWREEARPDPGWRERAELCNLYPLLVHLNLFGPGYLSSIRQIVYRYTY